MPIPVLDCNGRKVGEILEGSLQPYPDTPLGKVWFMKEIFPMPDENKFDMLREVCYTVRACCSICVHGTFIGLGQWG